MYILLAILLLAILVTIHEFGHFLAARLMKIDVREFSVGFGPKIFGWNSKKYDTVFSLRCIPLGGYCAFYGEDDASGVTKDDPRAFPNHSIWKRMFVILMGPVMNFVLAFVVAVGFYWCAGNVVPTEPEEYDPFIAEVMAGSPADRAGMKGGDIVTEINGADMLDGTMETLLNTISGWQEGNEPLRMTVLRGQETVELSVTPRWSEDAGKMQIGVYISGYRRTEVRPVGFLDGFKCAWDLCVTEGGAILRALKNLVTTGEGLDQTAGPVGIVSMVSDQVRQYGITAFIELLIMISINLGLMNLLPIPGLDGSRLVFGIIEVIRGKPIPPEKEAMVHLAGMVLLFGLMIFFTYNDIVKLVQGRLTI